MPHWYEIYEAPTIRKAAKHRLRRQAVLFALFASAVVVLAPIVALHAHHGMAYAAIGGSVLALYAAGLMTRLRAQRRTVWSVKLSFREIIGTDAGGHRTRVLWAAVQHLDVRSDGLCIRAQGGTRLHIPDAFPDYTHLAHRIVEYAEAYNCEVALDGRPWEAVSIHALISLLEETA